MPFYGSKDQYANPYAAQRDVLAELMMRQQGGQPPPDQPAAPSQFMPQPQPAPAATPSFDGGSNIPGWFQGGQGDWNRYLNNFAGFPGGKGDLSRLRANLNVGGQYLFDPFDGGDGSAGGVSGVSDSDVTGVGPSFGGDSQQPGGLPSGPPPPDSPPPPEGPQIVGEKDFTFMDQEAQAIANQQEQQFTQGTQGVPYAGAPQTSSPYSASPLPGVGASPSMQELMSNPAFNGLLNQGSLPEQGFSTAGMSLADLAEAWGVSIDSAAALAGAGFADFGGGGGLGDASSASAEADAAAAAAAAEAEAASSSSSSDEEE